MKPRLMLYGSLTTLVAVVIGATLYARGLNVHDYSSRRSSPEAHLAIDEARLDESFGHAFAFRVKETDEGPKVVFQSGMCLLAHRAQTNQRVTSLDELVQLAVVKLWREPWMSEYSRGKVEELRLEYVASVDGLPSDETLDAMHDRFLQGLVDQPGFRSRFEALLEAAAAERNQTLEWEETSERGEFTQP